MFGTPDYVRGWFCDIGIAAGRVVTVYDKIEGSAQHVVHAQSKLVTETFPVAHLHLDKVLTGSLADERTLTEYHRSSMSGAMTAVELASKVKEQYGESEIIERARKVLSDAELYGVSHLRAFADADAKARLTGIKALLKVKEEFKGRIGIQIVAFRRTASSKNLEQRSYCTNRWIWVRIWLAVFLG